MMPVGSSLAARSANQQLVADIEAAREKRSRRWRTKFLITWGVIVAALVMRRAAISPLHTDMAVHTSYLLVRTEHRKHGYGTSALRAKSTSPAGTPWPVNQAVYVDYMLYDLRDDLSSIGRTDIIADVQTVRSCQTAAELDPEDEFAASGSAATLAAVVLVSAGKVTRAA